MENVIISYPKISIVTPCFNSGKYLEETILSVLDQNYPNLEYVIIDGGSTDNTLDIIKKYEKKLAYWISEKDHGMYEAIEKGFNKSTGEIFAWINSDDLYHKKSFFIISEIFSRFQNVNWLVGAATNWDEYGRGIEVNLSRKFTRHDFLLGDYKFVQQESCFFRRTLYEKAGSYMDKTLKYAGDFELWLRFFEYEQLYVTDALIAGFRMRTENQLSLEGLPKYYEEIRDILKSEKIAKRRKAVFKQYELLYRLKNGISRFLIRNVKKCRKVDIKFNRNTQSFEMPPLSEVIVEAAFGQNSNRLFQNLHFECFCKEHNFGYCNPTFSDMAHLYVNPCNHYHNILFFIDNKLNFIKRLSHKNKLIRTCFSIIFIFSLMGIVKRIRFREKQNNEEILLTALQKRNTVYVSYFWFRTPKLIEKYREEMAHKYALKQEFYENNDFVKNIEELKLQKNVLIGVHIRRGDYVDWKNGVYYYEDSVYEKFMESISLQLSNQGIEKQVFIIFSNEKVKFQEKENLFISKEKWYIDQYLMSKCDYLIGPPSTFSLWAVYVGRVKFYHIFDKNKDVKLEDFGDFKHWEL